jgi:DNA end-binding protein Ku
MTKAGSVMSRMIWKGTVAFGLVEIPVAVYPAVSRREFSFTQLDRRTMTPIGYRRVNKATGDEVPWDEIVKGYEHQPGEFVVVSDEELAGANPEATKTIDIVDFVDARDIHPVHFETPYYLEPLKKKSKGYVLLRETLRRTGKVGIARLVLRTRQYLAAVMVRGQALMVDLLRYADEIRDADELALPDEDVIAAGVSEKELEMAARLVEGMSDTWDPARYRDEYREDVQKLIDDKVRTGSVHAVTRRGKGEPAKGTGDILDLMPLLKESLAHARPAKKPAAPVAAGPPPRRRAAGRSEPAPRTAETKRSRRSA